MGRTERDQFCIRDRQDECWQNRQEDAAVRCELAVRNVTRGAVQLVDADVRIVVNMAENPRSGEKTYATLAKACQNFLKTKPPLAAIIPRDTHVPDSIRRQTALLIRHPDSPAAKGVELLARQLRKAAEGDV